MRMLCSCFGCGPGGAEDDRRPPSPPHRQQPTLRSKVESRATPPERRDTFDDASHDGTEGAGWEHSPRLLNPNSSQPLVQTQAHVRRSTDLCVHFKEGVSSGGGEEEDSAAVGSKPGGDRDTAGPSVRGALPQARTMPRASVVGILPSRFGPLQRGQTAGGGSGLSRAPTRELSSGPPSTGDWMFATAPVFLRAGSRVGGSSFEMARPSLDLNSGEHSTVSMCTAQHEATQNSLMMSTTQWVAEIVRDALPTDDDEAPAQNSLCYSSSAAGAVGGRGGHSHCHSHCHSLSHHGHSHLHSRGGRYGAPSRARSDCLNYRPTHTPDSAQRLVALSSPSNSGHWRPQRQSSSLNTHASSAVTRLLASQNSQHLLPGYRSHRGALLSQVVEAQEARRAQQGRQPKQRQMSYHSCSNSRYGSSGPGVNPPLSTCSAQLPQFGPNSNDASPTPSFSSGHRVRPAAHNNRPGALAHSLTAASSSLARKSRNFMHLLSPAVFWSHAPPHRPHSGSGGGPDSSSSHHHHHHHADQDTSSHRGGVSGSPPAGPSTPPLDPPLPLPAHCTTHHHHHPPAKCATLGHVPYAAAVPSLARPSAPVLPSAQCCPLAECSGSASGQDSGQRLPWLAALTAASASHCGPGCSRSLRGPSGGVRWHTDGSLLDSGGRARAWTPDSRALTRLELHDKVAKKGRAGPLAGDDLIASAIQRAVKIDRIMSARATAPPPSTADMVIAAASGTAGASVGPGAARGRDSGARPHGFGSNLSLDLTGLSSSEHRASSAAAGESAGTAAVHRSSEPVSEEGGVTLRPTASSTLGANATTPTVTSTTVPAAPATRSTAATNIEGFTDGEGVGCETQTREEEGEEDEEEVDQEVAYLLATFAMSSKAGSPRLRTEGDGASVSSLGSNVSSIRGVFDSRGGASGRDSLLGSRAAFGSVGSASLNIMATGSVGSGSNAMGSFGGMMGSFGGVGGSSLGSGLDSWGASAAGAAAHEAWAGGGRRLSLVEEVEEKSGEALAQHQGQRKSEEEECGAFSHRLKPAAQSEGVEGELPQQGLYRTDEHAGSCASSHGSLDGEVPSSLTMTTAQSGGTKEPLSVGVSRGQQSEATSRQATWHSCNSTSTMAVSADAGVEKDGDGGVQCED